jgi:hypothetical protein
MWGSLLTRILYEGQHRAFGNIPFTQPIRPILCLGASVRIRGAEQELDSPYPRADNLFASVCVYVCVHVHMGVTDPPFNELLIL